MCASVCVCVHAIVWIKVTESVSVDNRYRGTEEQRDTEGVKRERETQREITERQRDPEGETQRHRDTEGVRETGRQRDAERVLAAKKKKKYCLKRARSKVKVGGANSCKNCSRTCAGEGEGQREKKKKKTNGVE